MAYIHKAYWMYSINLSVKHIPERRRPGSLPGEGQKERARTHDVCVRTLSARTFASRSQAIERAILFSSAMRRMLRIA